MNNLRSWSVAKQNVHDLSGVENPENWMWNRIDGVFYPEQEIVDVEEVVDDLFDKLDPDMSDEELVEMGYEIKMSKHMGEDIVDYREGCGHIG